MKKGIVLSLLLVFSVSHAEITVTDLIQNQDQLKFLNPKVEIVKEKDNHYYLKISQSSKRISRERIQQSSVLYKDLAVSREYSLIRQYYIPLVIESRVEGINRSYQKSIATDVDVKTNKFSNVRGRKVSELFGQYVGYTANAGFVLGGGYTRLQNSSGILLSELNGVFPIANFGVNIGLTLSEVEVGLVPLTDAVDIRFEMITVEQGEGFLSSESATRSMQLEDLINREL